MTQRTEPGWRHRMKVRVGGLKGQTGRLMHCDGRNGKFWKVRLDNGEWVWPDNLAVDGTGDHVGICLECRLPFIGTTHDLLCQACQDEHFGTVSQRVEDDGGRPRSSTYHRRRWAPSRHR